MFDRQSGQPQTPSSTSAAQTGSMPAERVMRIAPLDLRQQRFRTALRGFDRTEVVAFLTEAADDYEHALREIDRLRQDLLRMEALLTEHRERESQPAQHAADRAAARRRGEGRGAERRQDDRARGARDAPTCCCRRRRAGSRKSNATSPSCACGAAASRVAGVLDPGALSRARVHPRAGQARRAGCSSIVRAGPSPMRPAAPATSARQAEADDLTIAR